MASCQECGGRVQTEFELPGEWHGPELDEAMETEVDHSKVLIPGICDTALMARRTDFVEKQFQYAFSEDHRQEAREALRAEGVLDPTDEEIRTLALAGVIGGAFTYGIQIGLLLAGIEKGSLFDGR